MELSQKVATVKPPAGSVACSWLGQAGYVFKTSGGTSLMIDPYLSNYAEQEWAVHRRFPPPLTPETWIPDVILITHWHSDHLDVPTLRRYAEIGETVLVGPFSCIARARVWSWPPDKLIELDRGTSYIGRDVEVTATFARHDEPGALAEDAVGYLVLTEGMTLWHAGDTEYDARLRVLGPAGIDVAFLPINGGGSNMNAYEAALLAWELQAKLAIPMHYGMWPDDEYGADLGPPTLDPALFEDTYRKLEGRGATTTLQVGDLVLLESSGGGVRVTPALRRGED